MSLRLELRTTQLKATKTVLQVCRILWKVCKKHLDLSSAVNRASNFPSFIIADSWPQSGRVIVYTFFTPICLCTKKQMDQNDFFYKTPKKSEMHMTGSKLCDCELWKTLNNRQQANVESRFSAKMCDTLNHNFNNTIGVSFLDGNAYSIFSWIIYMN